jgi:hypothetical protein
MLCGVSDVEDYGGWGGGRDLGSDSRNFTGRFT